MLRILYKQSFDILRWGPTMKIILKIITGLMAVAIIGIMAFVYLAANNSQALLSKEKSFVESGIAKTLEEKTLKTDIVSFPDLSACVYMKFMDEVPQHAIDQIIERGGAVIFDLPEGSSDIFDGQDYYAAGRIDDFTRVCLDEINN